MSMNVIDLDEQRKQKEQANKPKSDLDSKLEGIRKRLGALIYDIEEVKKDILRIEEELDE